MPYTGGRRTRSQRRKSAAEKSSRFRVGNRTRHLLSPAPLTKIADRRRHWLKSIERAAQATWRPCEQPRSCWGSTSLSCTGNHPTREPKRLPSICALFRALQHCTARWRPCIHGCSGSRPAGSFGHRGWQPRTWCWLLFKPQCQQGSTPLASPTRDDCRSSGRDASAARWRY